MLQSLQQTATWAFCLSGISCTSVGLVQSSKVGIFGREAAFLPYCILVFDCKNLFFVGFVRAKRWMV